MEPEPFRLTSAPIVEAVVDIECDMPPKFDLGECADEAAARFSPQYPHCARRFVADFQVRLAPDLPPPERVRQSIDALRFSNEARKQLVQVRRRGFSFNRLAPYTSLDDYLAEIERTWKIFVDLAAPVQVQWVALRYINRLALPARTGGVEIGDYLCVGPRLPGDGDLTFTGFMNQHSAIDRKTGHKVNLILSALPREGDSQPVLFDIRVQTSGGGDTEDWPGILRRILSLRDLKNRIFKDTLTSECLSLFNPPTK